MSGLAPREGRAGATWTAPEERGRSGARPDSAPVYDVLGLGCSVLTIACWLGLRRSYGLFAHMATPAFSFDRVPGGFFSPTIRSTGLLFVALTLLYGAGYWLIRRATRVSGLLKLALIATVAGSAIVNVLIYPVAAIDVFYYLAELKLALFYHRNPYVVTFVPAYAHDLFARYGWPLFVRLAYGPAWLLVSSPAALLAGFGDVLRLLLGYKIFQALLAALAGVIVYAYHDDEKRRWLGLYVFLANPLLWFEAVANAHNDLVMTLFLLAALLALKRGSWLALPLLALAALTKVFAAVLLPWFLLALYAKRWPKGRVLLSGAAALAVTAVVVAPFWANGTMIPGMLGAMNFANGLKTASLISLAQTLLQQRHAPAQAYALVRLALEGLFVIAAPAITWRLRDLDRALVYALLLLFTLVGSIQPWYWIPIVGLLALRPDRLGFGYLMVASGLGLLIYLIDLWARTVSGLTFPQRHLLGALLLNVPIIVFLILDLRHARATHILCAEPSTNTRRIHG